MKNFIGVDIGATKIIFALLKGKKVIRKEKISTPETRRELIKELKGNIRNLLSPDIKKIGVGVPGILDYKKGIILRCPNLKYLNNFNLSEILEKELKIKEEREK